MALPPNILKAVSALGGGKITLIVGAGCSFEAPTSIPLAGTCSQECHDRLVANGVIPGGDCATPWDMSCLADAVVKATGSQQALVEDLREHYAFKAATPNEGHLLAAALLREGAVASVVTLNFDLALSAALALIGGGETVGIIEGPDDLQNQKAVNLYYLHRNAHAANPETWILRTEALKSEWKDSWEQIVTGKVISTPVILFVGLGSPADVLLESTKLIQKAIPNCNELYQVDPGARENSTFFAALGLDASAYIQAKWCDFMEELSQRLVLEHTARLKAAATTIAKRDGVTEEDLTVLLDRLNELGLLKLGGLRASWLLRDKPYYPDHELARELIADLLLAVSFLARATGALAVLFDDGVVEFRRAGRTVASYLLVSGGGTRSVSAIEAELQARRRRLRGRGTQPLGAIAAGTRDAGNASASAPSDVVLGDASDSILGNSVFPVYQVAQLRHTSDLSGVVP
jgi:hypothetical protein